MDHHMLLLLFANTSHGKPHIIYIKIWSQEGRTEKSFCQNVTANTSNCNTFIQNQDLGTRQIREELQAEYDNRPGITI